MVDLIAVCCNTATEVTMSTTSEAILEIVSNHTKVRPEEITPATLMENLAVEVSPVGVRVVCLRTTANTDSRSIQDTMDALAGKMNRTYMQVIGDV